MMVLEAVDLAKVYRGGDGGTIIILDGVDLSVRRGEIVAVVGASGAGKSTLLHLLGALDQPTRGTITIAGQRVPIVPFISPDNRGTLGSRLTLRQYRERRATRRSIQKSD